MAVKTGRGFAAIEYPTGMNQNGDPSQAWIKVKPDGRIDVFAGTSDIGNGSKTIQSQIVAETIGVPYEWITYDNSNTDSSPVCTGTFASRATFVAGKAVEKAGVPNIVWYNYRRVPAVTYAKQLIDEGKLGKIFHYRAKFLQDWTISKDLPQGGAGLWRLDAGVAGSGW